MSGIERYDECKLSKYRKEMKKDFPKDVNVWEKDVVNMKIFYNEKKKQQQYDNEEEGEQEDKISITTKQKDNNNNNDDDDDDDDDDTTATKPKNNKSNNNDKEEKENDNTNDDIDDDTTATKPKNNKYNNNDKEEKENDNNNDDIDYDIKQKKKNKKKINTKKKNNQKKKKNEKKPKKTKQTATTKKRKWMTVDQYANDPLDFTSNAINQDDDYQSDLQIQDDDDNNNPRKKQKQSHNEEGSDLISISKFKMSKNSFWSTYSQDNAQTFNFYIYWAIMSLNSNEYNEENKKKLLKSLLKDKLISDAEKNQYDDDIDTFNTCMLVNYQNLIEKKKNLNNQ